MDWQKAPYVVLAALAAAVAGVLAYITWRRRPAAGVLPLAWLLLAVAEWSLGYAFELGTAFLPAKILWAKVQYLGIVSVPVAWLAFTLQYTGRDHWLTRRNLILLALTPLVTLLLVWTNEVHGLIWSGVALGGTDLGAVLALTYGPWFWIHAAYSYLLLLSGTLLLVGALIDSSHLYRGQTGVLLIGAILPWLANVLYLTGLSPLPHLDLTPFAFTASGVVLAWGLLYYRLLDIVPVARDAVVESLLDGVIALDTQNRIVDLNAAAQRLIGMTASEVIGRPLAKVVPAWKDVAASASNGIAAPAEILLGDGDERRIYEPQIAPLHDRHDRLSGQLLVLHDVTERRRAEEERARLAGEQAARAAAEQAADRVRRLQTVTAALSEALTGEQVAEVVVTQGVEALGASAGSVALLRADGSQLVVVRAVGYPPEVLEAYRIIPLAAELPLAEAVRTGEPILLEAPEARNARYPQLADSSAGPAERGTWAAIPLVIEGRTVGAMGLSFAAPRDFSAEDREFMLTLARQCAQALERARLYEAERQARAEAEHAREQATTILESITDAFYAVDREWRFTYVNRKAEQLWGRERESLIGKNVWEEFPHSVDSQFYTEFHRAAAERQAVEFEAFSSVSGNWIRVNAYPSREGLSVYFRDISARKRDEALQHFLAEASAALVSSLDYEITLQSVALLVVPVLADLCAVDVLEDDGSIRRVAVVAADPDKDLVVRDLQRRSPPEPKSAGTRAVIDSGERISVSEVPDSFWEEAARDADHLALLRALGIRSFMIVPLVARGRTLGAITFLMAESGRHYDANDVAVGEEIGRRAALAVDNARLYREAQQAIRARDTFLSLASHELKTPLAALQGHAELLLRSAQRATSLDERSQRSVRVIYAQAVRFHRLIELLLDFSRLQTGWLSIERHPIDLPAVVRRLVEGLEPTLEQHTIDLIAPHEPLIVEGDEVRLGQVLENLINNAVKYSPKGGPITVCLDRQDDQARLTVSDRGLGVPEEALDQIFSHFYRAPNVDPRRISGLGIGLAVVKEVVTLHGGTVEVSSRQGEGSVFTVRLPLLAAEQLAAHEEDGGEYS